MLLHLGARSEARVIIHKQTLRKVMELTENRGSVFMESANPGEFSTNFIVTSPKPWPSESSNNVRWVKQNKKSLGYGGLEERDPDAEASKARKFTNPFLDNQMNKWYYREPTVANGQGDGYIKMNVVETTGHDDERPSKRQNVRYSFGQSTYGVHHHQQPPMRYPNSALAHGVSRTPPDFGRDYGLRGPDESLLRFCEQQTSVVSHI